MIVISLVLVVVSAISLLVGGLFRDDLALIWVSIGAALAAAAFLGTGVLRGTRRRKPVTAATLPGEDAAGKPATWQGAGWGGAEAAGGEALGREEEMVSFVEATPVTTSGDRGAEETTRLDEAAYAPPALTPAPSPAPAPGPQTAWAPPAPPKPATPSPAPAVPPPAPTAPAVRRTPTPPPPPPA